MLDIDDLEPLFQVQIKAQPEPILEGELFAEIKEEDSTWSIGTFRQSR